MLGKIFTMRSLFSLPSLGLLDVVGCAVITLKPQDTFELNYIAQL